LDFSISVRFCSVFNLKYSVKFCFGFGIHTPPQSKSFLVCENTKTELINFHKKFQLKYIDRPRLVWRSYPSHLVWSAPSHSLWWVPLSICHNLKEFKNRIIQTETCLLLV